MEGVCMPYDNDDAKLLGILNAAVISKACRGRYINVRRTIRDVESISDSMADTSTKDEATMDKLVTLLGNGSKQADQNAKDIKSLGKLVERIADSLKK